MKKLIYYLTLLTLFIYPVAGYSQALPQVRHTGRATWYGNGAMHGNVRADGERFDPMEPLVAHRWIPLGTYILVVSKDNQVCVPVLDRGPYGADLDGQWVLKRRSKDPGNWRGLIDMSYGAALKLHNMSEGERPPNIIVDIHYRTLKGDIAKTERNCIRKTPVFIKIISKYLESGARFLIRGLTRLGAMG